MKILRIIYDWPRPWSGLAPHPYEITISQRNIGHDVSIFCGHWPKSGYENPDKVNIMPIRRELMPNTIFFTSSIVLFFKYLLWRRNKNNKVDIIHSHGHFGIWIYAYRAFLKMHMPWSTELKTPLVVHFHNTAKGRWEKFNEEHKSISYVSKHISWPLTVFSDKMAVKSAAACVFVSNETKSEALKYYNADPKRCFVIESGVNTDLFKPTSHEEKEKSKKDLGLDLYDKVILNHGVLNERKNIHLLIESLKYLPDNYKLILSGPSSPSYLERLNEIINENHLTSRVIKTGYVPYPQCPIAYQIADVFVLPSSWEGLPKVVMEALACGVPCLASGFKLSEDILGLSYLQSTDPKDIALNIKDICSKNTVVDINKVRKIYSWDARVKVLDDIYDFAIKNYI